jgi:hypothetical protein
MEFLTIIFDDETTAIPIYVDKKHLVNLCNYFRSMLLSEFSESRSNTITVKVPNAMIWSKIMIDIIYEKYYDSVPVWRYLSENVKFNDSVPVWRYLLENFKFNDYFDIDYNRDSIKRLIIPPSYFDELIEMVPIFGSDKNFYKLLAKNFPKDFDLSKLSEEIMLKILEHDPEKKIHNYLILLFRFSTKRDTCSICL